MSRHNKETKEIDRIVGNKIANLRILSGMSRDQLADKVDVSHQQISKYENGCNRISIGRLVLISRVFTRPLSYFIEDDADDISDQNTRLTMDVARNFSKIKSFKNKQAISNLINTMIGE